MSDWQADKAVAQAILSDRRLRRRALAISLMVALVLLALGLWVIDAWLEDVLWRFLLWWSGCALVSLWVLLFALFDALKSIQEARDEVSSQDRGNH